MEDFKIFVEHLRNGNLEGVKNNLNEEFVDKIIDDDFGTFPIHVACEKGFVDIANLLLQHNCNIECEDKLGRTPIFYGCWYEKIEIVKLLLQRNCIIECETARGRRPIYYANRKGNVEIVKLLLDNNCNFEYEDSFRKRQIHYACSIGDVEIVKLLLQHNCNIECENFLGWRPIHFAIENKHVEIVKLLLQRNCNIECITKDGDSPMELAERNENKEIIYILNARKLLIACKNGIVENLPSLLDIADVECCDEDNRRPIHWACLNGHIEIVKLLIGRNCKIDTTDNFNLSPMKIAENDNNKELIKILKSEISDRQILEQLISMMGLTCEYDCDHKLCPKSLKNKIFDKESPIGNGAFGKVFKCKGSGTDKIFAMKRVKLKQNDSKSIEGDIDKFLPILNHVRIVQYFGAIETDKDLWIFMEFVPGGSLQDKITKEKFIRMDEIIQYSKQILEGLQFLHENKIIYRDLKPANILMDLDNNIKLADFGLGRALVRTFGTSTNAHTVVGTVNFMAPEVINHEPYNVAADIWSLGATIVNMITGKPPYHDDQSISVMKKISISKKLELPESTEISNEMKTFIEHLIKSDPNCRPTAADLLKFKIFSQ